MYYRVINKVRIMCINNENKKGEKIIIDFNYEDYKSVIKHSLYFKY